MSTLTGFGRLVRLILRRDRLRLPLWLVGLGGVVVASAASLPPVYPDQQAIDDYVRLFGDNPALITFAGPGYGFDDPSIGVILVNETQLWGMVGVALMAVFLVNRHTRAEEDEERAELVRSSVVGRHAPDLAALAVVSGVVVLLGVVCGASFVLLDYPVAGSIALAASLSAVGLVFVGITAVAAQVSSSGRATIGAGSLALLVAFVLRAVGDIGDNALRWLSPIGWGQSVRAFADERWWVLGLCLAVALVLVLVAAVLFDRRDLGAGLLVTRAGRAHAGRSLRSPLGLALRLQRGVLLGWIVGLFVTGVVYGSIADEIEEMIADNPVYADIFTQLGGGSITDAFLATALVMLALIASGYPISAALRMRTEENAGRADSVLATPVSRWRWMASHLAVTIAGAVLIVTAGGLGTGLGVAVVLDDADQVLRLAGASLVTVPPVLVLTGVTVALYGLVPKAALAAWAALALVAVVGFLGEVLRLPDWTRDLSPFEHVPAVPAVDVRWLPLAVLLAVAAALVAAGAWGFRRRDIAAT